jgi:hypothetical protein|nr:hypothetical protein [Kofleriaceae bacterium]
MKRLAVATAVVMACGGGGGGGHGKPGDGGGGDAAPSHTVLLNMFQPPDFIAYHTGDGPWQTPTFGSNGYELVVANDYVVLVVCDNAGSGTAFDAEEYGFTFDGDGSAIFAECLEPAIPGAGSGLPITVTGTMAQAGSVQLGGGGATSGSAAWTYSAATVAGVHDVFALDGSGNAVFDKAIDFEPGSDATVSGPAIDTAAQGAPLVTQPLTILNLGADAVLVSSDVVSTDGANIAVGSVPSVVTLPLSELGGDDLQFISVDTDGSPYLRHAEALTIGAELPPTTYSLLDPFATTSFDVSSAGATASWVTLPAATGSVALGLSSTAGNQGIEATTSYLAARGLTSLAFDASAPGYLDAWTVDPTHADLELVEIVTDPATGIEYASSAPSPTPLVARPRARSRARILANHGATSITSRTASARPPR